MGSTTSSRSDGDELETSTSSSSTDGDQRLYVAPNQYSLLMLEMYCLHPRPEPITELIYIGNIVGREEVTNPLDLHDFRKSLEHKIAIGDLILKAGFAVSTRIYAEAFEMYRWIISNAQEIDEESAYSTLVQCLPKLPHLVKIGIQEKVDAPGLNQDAIPRPDLYFEETEADRIRQKGLAMLAYGTLSGEDRFSTEITEFLRALHDANISVTEFSIGSSLVDQMPHNLDNKVPSDFHWERIVGQVTSLTSSIKDATSTESGKFWGSLISHAQKVQTLRIFPDCGDGTREYVSPEHGSILSSILPTLTFPDLHTFEIIAKPFDPANVRAAWLNHFLRRHAKSLRKVALHGALPVNWYKPRTAKAVMSAFLDFLRDNLQLEEIKVLLGQRPRDGRNEESSYVLAGGGRLESGEIGKLAQERHVALKDGVWDFGDRLLG